MPLTLVKGGNRMPEKIIKPITSDGKITIPKEFIEKYNLKNYVEIEETRCYRGIIIKKHI